MSEPLVAVITRTRDRLPLLRRAVESVLGQSWPHWRHVIVNDGGAPGPLEEFLATYGERYAGRLQVIHLPQAVGMQPAANEGIRASRSDALAIHDDDDSWHPDFLRETASALAAHGAESVYQGVVTHTWKIVEDLEEDGTVTEISREPYLPLPEINFFRLGYQNPFPPIAFVFRRSAFAEVGEYDPRFNVAADLDFNFRFLQRYEIAVVPKPLAYYHWRRRAPDRVFQNTVTAGQEEHGRRLNEFRNFHLRGGDGRTPRELGLALNLAALLYEGQWIEKLNLQAAERVEERLERVLRELGGEGYAAHFSSLAEALALLLERARDCKIHLTSATGLLEDQARRLGDLQEHLASLSARQGDRAEDFKAHLTSATGLLEEQARRLAVLQEHLASLSADQSGMHLRAEDFKAHLTSATGMLEGQAERLSDLKVHLTSVTGRMEVWETRFAETRAQLSEMATGLAAQSAQSATARSEAQAGLATLAGRQEEWRAVLMEQARELAVLREGLAAETSARAAESAAWRGELGATASALEALASEWRTFRRARRRLFRLGPLVLEWETSARPRR